LNDPLRAKRHHVRQMPDIRSRGKGALVKRAFGKIAGADSWKWRLIGHYFAVFLLNSNFLG
jgi:hypothetical protein